MVNFVANTTSASPELLLTLVVEYIVLQMKNVKVVNVMIYAMKFTVLIKQNVDTAIVIQ